MRAAFRLAVILCALLAGAFPARVMADDAPAPHIHVVAFGLSNASPVFTKEAAAAARIVAGSFEHSGQVIVRANTQTHSGARIADLRATLIGLGETMDAGNDIVFLILTSHGSRAGAAVTAIGHDETLSPARLSGMLSVAHIKRRVIVVSACYSGVFVDMLADDDTLVISAADSNHPSFGCGSADEWTYFGFAFFAQAFGIAKTLPEAFAAADGFVRVREFLNGYEHSNPQMAGGAAILPLLVLRPR